jgi:hypothetical protein
LAQRTVWHHWWQVADTKSNTDAELLAREAEAALDMYSVKLDYTVAEVLGTTAADVAVDEKEPGNKNLKLLEEAAEAVVVVEELERMHLSPRW